MHKIKDFFTKKRCRKLKLLNNKGFSLIEVLVAVTIIGIISAIAIPRFQDYRESAGLVVGDTSLANIEKAFHNCITLKELSECLTLDNIKVTCADCEATNNSNDYPVCFSYAKKAGGKDFKMCVSIDKTGKSTKKIGGDFKVCWEDPTGAPVDAVMSPIKRCSTADNNFCGSVSTSVYTCKKQTGATAGTCSTAGVCQ